MCGSKPLSRAGTQAWAGRSRSTRPLRDISVQQPGSLPVASPAPRLPPDAPVLSPGHAPNTRAVCSLTDPADCPRPGLAPRRAPPASLHQAAPNRTSGCPFQPSALCRVQTGQPLWPLEGMRSSGFIGGHVRQCPQVLSPSPDWRLGGTQSEDFSHRQPSPGRGPGMERDLTLTRDPGSTRERSLLGSVVRPGVPRAGWQGVPRTSRLHRLCVHQRAPAAPPPQTLGPARGVLGPEKDRAPSRLHWLICVPVLSARTEVWVEPAEPDCGQQSTACVTSALPH